MLRLVALALALSVVSAGKNPYPLVMAHGMGDTCFQDAWSKDFPKAITAVTGSPSKCIPTGNFITDPINGYLMTMNHNVDKFAEGITKWCSEADVDCSKGINCMGASQGNLLCRGYIHRYNDPPVMNWLSAHGCVVGVAGFPKCDPDGLLGPVCKQISHLCGDLAYKNTSQNLLFQLDYYRDPMRVNTTAYKNFSQLAQWNNEGLTFNQTYKDNFIKVKKMVMIKALKDTMIYPNQGEWWGHFKDGSLKKEDILSYKETDWYQKDMFGLKTVDEAGKIIFNSTDTDHMGFTLDDVVWWIDNYFVV